MKKKSLPDIISEYSKTQLQEMFFVIYGRNPRTNESKKSIGSSIKKCFRRLVVQKLLLKWIVDKLLVFTNFKIALE